MQGLVNFTTAIADGISVMLPAFCYLAACWCFLFAAWTLRGMAYQRHHHHHHMRPWVPWVSLLLSGVFATFPGFINRALISFGSPVSLSLTSYTPTTPGSAVGVLGAGPAATVVNVITMFQYFFEAFGAACVFWSVWMMRSLINGRSNGSATACGIQFTFGVLCINIVQVANGLTSLFSTGG